MYLRIFFGHYGFINTLVKCCILEATNSKEVSLIDFDLTTPHEDLMKITQFSAIEKT
jgi:hypothetical protein